MILMEQDYSKMHRKTKQCALTVACSVPQVLPVDTTFTLSHHFHCYYILQVHFHHSCMICDMHVGEISL